MKKKETARTLKLTGEDNMQAACVAYYAHAFPQYARLLHHSANEGRRSYWEAARNNVIGTQKGFPDLFLAVARGSYHGLFVEMKTKDGKASDEQKDMLARLSAQGYLSILCRSVSGFRLAVAKYMNLKENEKF